MRSATAIGAMLALSGSTITNAQKPPIRNFQCTTGTCKDGYGVQEHPAGFKYEGQFVGGERKGLGVETMPGNVRYAGSFAEGSAAGFGVMMFPDGRHFAGEWKNEFPHGCGLSLEVTRPDEETKLVLKHIGRWEEGEIVDPEKDCHVEVNKAHDAAKAAIAQVPDSVSYEYTAEEPRKPKTKEELIGQLERMQQNIIELISLVSGKAAESEVEEAEKLSETLHGLEVTFVKMYFGIQDKIGDSFTPLFSRDALETVIFETMLEIDESAVEDPSNMENQLAAMEQALEDFPTEDEQNILLVQKHVELTAQAVERHKAAGETKQAGEASVRLEELKQQVEDLKNKPSTGTGDATEAATSEQKAEL